MKITTEELRRGDIVTGVVTHFEQDGVAAEITAYDEAGAKLVAEIARRCADENNVDAARWRAFINSPYIKFQGSAGLRGDFDPNGRPHGNYAHFGMEIWTQYDFTGLSAELVERTARASAANRELLIKYADKALAAQMETP